jgi:hypothetical protein
MHRYERLKRLHIALSRAITPRGKPRSQRDSALWRGAWVASSIKSATPSARASSSCTTRRRLRCIDIASSAPVVVARLRCDPRWLARRTRAAALVGRTRQMCGARPVSAQVTRTRTRTARTARERSATPALRWAGPSSPGWRAILDIIDLLRDVKARAATSRVDRRARWRSDGP